MDASSHIASSGCAWRMLPRCFPPTSKARGCSDSMHHLIASRRSTTVPPADLFTNVFAEGPAATAGRGAPKSAHGQQDRHRPTADGQIGQSPDIAAVAGPRQCSTCGTAGLERSQTTANEDAIRADVLMLNNNTGRNQAQPLDRSAHKGKASKIQPSLARIRSCILVKFARESRQSPFCTPIHSRCCGYSLPRDGWRRSLAPIARWGELDEGCNSSSEGGKARH